MNTTIPWQEILTAQKARLLDWLSTPQFYIEVLAIVAALVVARVLAAMALRAVPPLRAPANGVRLQKFQHWLYSCRDLVAPLLTFIVLGLAAALCTAALGSAWLVRLAQSAAIIVLLYSAITRFIAHPLINALARWAGIPAATIYVFGFLPQVIAFLDSAAFEAGNIRISLLSIAKAGFFGGILFWAGRILMSAGQRVIRKQDSLDIQTRELAAKGYDLTVVAVSVLLLMNLMGMDLSTLAVFSGAVGVGLGFGLQQITSNFISGIIILLERSLKLGDYIELDDGRQGTLTALNMRSSTLSTFDGKEIMVPNERFITTRFVNWTHSDPRQRYEVPFSLPYGTDIRLIPPLIEKAILGCACVLKEPEMPECAFKSFGDNFINFTAKFWANGIDDGKNSFTAQVGFAIWNALHDAGIPLRAGIKEVHIIEDRSSAAPAPRAKPAARKANS